jgi:hypothetical protein
MKNMKVINLSTLSTTPSYKDLANAIASSLKENEKIVNKFSEIRVFGWSKELRSEFLAHLPALKGFAAQRGFAWVFVKFVGNPVGNPLANDVTPEEDEERCARCNMPGTCLCDACEGDLESWRGDFGPLTPADKAKMTKGLNARRKKFGWNPVIVD